MSKRALLATYFVLLFALHQDFWWRADASLVFGIVPVSLAYHAVWTLLVAVGWGLVATFAWPTNLDDTPAPTDSPTTVKSGPPR